MILEYNDVIGGRALHTEFGKQEDGSPYVIELGANWVSSATSRRPSLYVTLISVIDSRPRPTRRTW